MAARHWIGQVEASRLQLGADPVFLRAALDISILMEQPRLYDAKQWAVTSYYVAVNSPILLDAIRIYHGITKMQRLELHAENRHLNTPNGQHEDWSTNFVNRCRTSILALGFPSTKISKFHGFLGSEPTDLNDELNQLYRIVEYAELGQISSNWGTRGSSELMLSPLEKWLEDAPPS